VTAVRRNLITGEPILFAPEREARPNAFGEDGASCPFCPGNEEMTPPEIARVGEPWRVRVFPNKYPFAEHHEVIVESQKHDAVFDEVDADEVVRMYVDRYCALVHRIGVRSVMLFKNHGRIAGASLPHIHSQIAALGFVPPRIASEERAFAKSISCPLCDAINTHRVAELVIDETPSMVRLAPHGSSFAHQQWIMPKRHCNDLENLRETEFRELAVLLQRATAGMRKISPSHNWAFLNFPAVNAAHCYVDVFPRTTSVAGFELGTGTFIDSIDPALTVRTMSD